jgi:hypothetical protein
MFGLEKKRTPLPEFDLEKEIKQNPSKAQEILKKAEKKELDIKAHLRTKCFNSSAKENDNLNALMHGYAAMKKVLDLLVNKK